MRITFEFLYATANTLVATANQSVTANSPRFAWSSANLTRTLEKTPTNIYLRKHNKIFIDPKIFYTGYYKLAYSLLKYIKYLNVFLLFIGALTLLHTGTPQRADIV